MSAFQYSQNVETKVIDASNYVANRYVEFKLDEEEVNYLSDIRLINLGCTAANTPIYNALGGAINLIKHIEILDGREVLCSARHISPYLAFQQTRQPNEKNKSVNNFLQKSDYGYQALIGGIKTGGDPATVQADATTPVSHISLRDCLPLLERTPALSTDMFKNLRIRIEFETAPQKVISTADAITTTEPSLCVDIVRGKMAMPSQVAWLEIEHDEYVLQGENPSTANQPKKIETSVRLNGFNNKYVERMLLVKQFDDLTKYGTSHIVKNGSLALFKEEFQVRSNGVNIFPSCVIDKDCVRANIMEDAWGVLNVVQHFNKCYTTDDLLAGSQVGLTDYTGCVLADAVKDLQIQHNRSCINDSATDSKPNSVMKVHVYAECRKVLNMKGGEYQVLYA